MKSQAQLMYVRPLRYGIHIIDLVSIEVRVKRPRPAFSQNGQCKQAIYKFNEGLICDYGSLS